MKQTLSLALFVSRVAANDSQHSPAMDDLALFANRLHGRPHFHGNLPLFRNVA
jgi:hypothetical protein